MKNRFLLTLFLFTLMAFPKSSWGKVLFENIPKSVIANLQKQMPKVFADQLSPQSADKIVKYLFKTKLFQNVAVYKQGNSFRVVGYTLKKIAEIKIEGNSAFSEEDLLEKIKLKTSAKFDRKKAIAAANTIKEHYGVNGYLNAKIEVSFVNESKNNLELTFSITENEPCIIKDIQVTSDNEKAAKAIVKELKSYKKEIFTEGLIKALQEKAKNYLKDKQYLRTRLEQIKAEYNKENTEVTLFYRLDNPFRYELAISGNKDLSQADIRRNVALSQFEVSTLDPSIEVEQKVKKLYLSKGYPHIKIETTEKTKEDFFSKQINLEVEEGFRVKIDSLNVVGRISKPEDYYSNFILENSSELLNSKYYNRKDLELGYENLITYLKNQGYLDAKIHSARIDFNKSKDKARIQIVMDEGPLTQVRRIRFRGVKDFSQIELSKEIDLKINSPLRLKLLEQSIIKLKEFYYTRGYLEMRITNENEELIKYNEKRTDATIEFKIHEGPKLVVNTIVVEGNEFTDENVILKEIELEKGETLTQKRIQIMVKRLNRLGFFSRVTIRTLEEGTSISERTVIISVTERQPGLFRAGVGITSEDDLTLRGFIGTSYNNISGTGKGISGRVEAQSNVTKSQYLETKVSMGYFEPFMFSSRMRGRINLTYEVEELDYDEDTDTVYLRESNRMDFLLEKEITEKLKLTWTTWSIETERTFTDPVSNESTDSRIASVGPLFSLDYRNNPFLPTSGSYTLWGTQYSAPLLGSSDGVEFIRTDLRFSFYIPIASTGIVWANNISGGYLKNLSNETDGGVPSSRGFFLHGQSKIRGFGGSNRVEHIPNVSQFESLDDIITGESHYYLFKTELRFPLPHLDPLSLAVFYDVGAIEFTDDDKQCTSYDDTRTICYSTDPVRHSVGIGVHVKTPLGPIVLELARKIDPRLGEREDRIHFSIGSF